MVKNRTNPSLTRRDFQTLLWTKTNIDFPLFVVVYEEVHGGSFHPHYMNQQYDLMQKCFLDFAVKWPSWADALVDAYLAGRHRHAQADFPPASSFWDDYR